jgi:hypothetical protein
MARHFLKLFWMFIFLLILFESLLLGFFVLILGIWGVLKLVIHSSQKLYMDKKVDAICWQVHLEYLSFNSQKTWFNSWSYTSEIAP